MNSIVITGNICCPISKRIYAGAVFVENGIITRIEEQKVSSYNNYILPGLIDAHVHIESSLLAPSEFARGAVVHGTVATVSDPHEIGNVCGIEGVKFMIENGKRVPFKFNFGASPCVPATTFETSGFTISPEEIEELLKSDDIKYMSEMMNYPGVLYEFPDVMRKIELAKKYNKPIDGHAPGLKGEQAKKYAEAGISTDHECYSIDEALSKIEFGMKVIIREGTAAKNFETLHPLLTSHPDYCMFCSDDKHPDDLLIGHINKLIARAVAKGHYFFDVLRAATFNPVKHYKLDVGLLQVGDPADLTVINNLTDFEVISTYIDGNLVYDNGKCLIDRVEIIPINNFKCSPKIPSEFEVLSDSDANVNVIDAIEGQLITQRSNAILKSLNGKLEADTNQDILKISVVNRYENVKPAIAFIRNFGLKRGALASSVGHDSHNIIAVGTNDDDLAAAINLIIEHKGGLSVVDGNNKEILPLPLAGLMCLDDVQTAGSKYTVLNKKTRELGCTLHSPFMTASFMALLVIPSIKLSDKGLFDGNKFEFLELLEK